MEQKLGRGISLRKKRTVKQKISNPIITKENEVKAATLPSVREDQRRPPLVSNPSSNSLTVPRARGAPQESTADYVKRRYSTRIPQLPKDFGDGAPTLPSVPGEFLGTPPERSGTKSRSRERGEKVPVEMKALQDPNLPAEQYVARLLANASEQDIQVYQQDLGKVKNRTSTDLQYNAYQNRSQFIKISQEADKLKGEMRALRNLMSDLTGTLNQTNAALGINTSDTVSARKYANRSSVANLEAMWSTHLQELWRRVEGSQKFLPAIPGRHVVHESGRWVELNTATFKPRRRVHLILLNDHFLVACEKKRMDASPNPEGTKPKPGAAHNQLVADKCIPIQEVEVVDLASSQDGGNRRGSQQRNIGNAINVRVAGESFTFAATGSSDANEKATLLAKFRKAVADMRKLLHADIDDHAIGGASPRKGLNGSNTNLPKSPGEVSSATRGSMLVEVDGQQQNFRWVENQVDELDIAIALQRFEDAVERVDKLRRIAKSNKNNSVVQDLVDGKVHARASKLAKSITRQLVERSSYLNATKKHTGWLIKLGFEARASEAFLEARGDALTARSGQCVNTGDLHQYMYQVSYICFTMIRNTVRIYQACFPQNTTSACVRWAKRHVDEFNALLARQVNRLPRGSEEQIACMDTVKAHAEMLGEVSIDFRNLVGQGVEDD